MQCSLGKITYAMAEGPLSSRTQLQASEAHFSRTSLLETEHWLDGRRKLSLNYSHSVTLPVALRVVVFLALPREDSMHASHARKNADIQTLVNCQRLLQDVNLL
jgi:hypothetical protein